MTQCNASAFLVAFAVGWGLLGLSPEAQARSTPFLDGLIESARSGAAKNQIELFRQLPEELRRNAVLVRASESSQGGTRRHPRVVLFDRAGRHFLGARGLVGDASYNRIEAIEQDQTTLRTHFLRIDFTRSPAVAEVDPRGCFGCHGEVGRPIWPLHNLWANAYGPFWNVGTITHPDEARFLEQGIDEDIYQFLPGVHEVREQARARERRRLQDSYGEGGVQPLVFSAQPFNAQNGRLASAVAVPLGRALGAALARLPEAPAFKHEIFSAFFLPGRAAPWHRATGPEGEAMRNRLTVLRADTLSEIEAEANRAARLSRRLGERLSADGGYLESMDRVPELRLVLERMGYPTWLEQWSPTIRPQRPAWWQWWASPRGFLLDSIGVFSPDARILRYAASEWSRHFVPPEAMNRQKVDGIEVLSLGALRPLDFLPADIRERDTRDCAARVAALEGADLLPRAKR